MNEQTCAHCGAAGGRKVSAIYSEGTWRSRTDGTSTGFRHDKHGKWRPDTRTYTEHHSGETLLAHALSPPDEPSPTLLVLAGILAALFVIGLWIVSVGFIHQIAGGLIGQALALLFVMMVVSILFGPAERIAAKMYKDHRRQKARWEEAMQKWGSFYYCGHCDRVYDPQSGKSAAPHDIRTLYSP